MSSSKQTLRALLATGAAVAALGAALPASAALTIIINNVNAAGVGFNDTTPATPVGGNAGTTLGQQRLIAFTYAANLWGASLTSNVPVIINAQFSALTCTASSATHSSMQPCSRASKWVESHLAKSSCSRMCASTTLACSPDTSH